MNIAAKDGLRIKKGCALAPCHLRDPGLVFIQFKEECDTNKGDCIYCCPNDGCNKDGVSLISSNNYLTLLLLTVGALSSLIFNSTYMWLKKIIFSNSHLINYSLRAVPILQREWCASCQLKANALTRQL